MECDKKFFKDSYLQARESNESLRLHLHKITMASEGAIVAMDQMIKDIARRRDELVWLLQSTASLIDDNQGRGDRDTSGE
jgi:hypothetical protein